MRVQHPEEHLDVIARLRNFKIMPVRVLVAKGNFQLELARDEVERFEPERELLQKTAQNKEQRLNRFDFIFELERFLEKLRHGNELEKTRRFPARPVPKLKTDRAKPRADCFLLQSGKPTQRMNSPAMQDREH